MTTATTDSRAVIEDYVSALQNGHVEAVRAIFADEASWKLDGDLPNATRWLQSCVVIVSNATGRKFGRATSRMPPRGVTTDIDISSLAMSARSSGSRMNSAIAPKVPRLHCACGSASWSTINSKALAIVSPSMHESATSR